MAVGYAVTKPELDQRAGALAQTFQKAFEDVVTLHGYLSAAVNADLLAMGFTDAEVATLKTAIADLAHLGRLWVGAEALPEAKDFRTFVRRLWGIGSF
jgi:hypothetical protein